MTRNPSRPARPSASGGLRCFRGTTNSAAAPLDLDTPRELCASCVGPGAVRAEPRGHGPRHPAAPARTRQQTARLPDCRPLSVVICSGAARADRAGRRRTTRPRTTSSRRRSRSSAPDRALSSPSWPRPPPMRLPHPCGPSRASAAHPARVHRGQSSRDRTGGATAVRHGCRRARAGSLFRVPALGFPFSPNPGAHV